MTPNNTRDGDRVTSSLFLDSPADREKRIDRMIVHFRHAEWMFFDRHHTNWMFADRRRKGIPTTTELMWLLMADAMHTARNTPFSELKQISAVRTVMPGARISPQQAYELQVSRLASGMDQYDDKKVRPSIRESDIDRMVDVLDMMRLVQGRNADRMRRVCLARAAGLSLEQCGRIWDRRGVYFDRRAMHDIKTRVIGQVLLGVEKHFGLKRTGRGFRRLTVREIEKRKKRRQREEMIDEG